MPEPMEFTIEADDQPASDAMGRVRSGLLSIERVAVEAGRRASVAMESLSRGVVRVAEATGGLIARQAFREFRDLITGIESDQRRAIVTAENLADAYRGVRLSIAAATGGRAALLGTGVTLGLGAAIEAAIRQTRRFGEELQATARQAAISGAQIEDALTIRRAGTILGQDLSAFVGQVSVGELRGFVEELRQIEDPYLQAARASELFGRNAEQALGLLRRPTEEAIDSAFSLTRTLDGQTRIAVENARRSFDSFGGAFDGITQGLRRLREEAKQLIAVRVALAVDFVNRGGLSNFFGGGFGDSGAGGSQSGPGAPKAQIVPSLAQIVQDAVTRNAGDRVTLPATASDVRGVRARPEAILSEDARRAQEAVRQYESSLDGVHDRLEAARKRRDALFAIVATGTGRERAQFGGTLLAAQQEVRTLEARVKVSEDVANAEKRAADILQQAKRAEFTGLADIIQEYKLYRAELGLSEKANRDLAEAARIRINTEAIRELRRNAQDAVRQIEDERARRAELDGRRLRESTEFSTQTLQVEQQVAEQRFRIQEDFAQRTRDAALRQLEFQDTRTLGQKIFVEQRKAAIEEEFLTRQFALRAASLDREVKLEITSMEIIARARGISEEQIAAKRDALLQLAAEKGRQLEESTQAAIDAARENSAARQAQAVRDTNQRIFDDLKRSANGILDNLLTSGKTFGQKMADLFKVPFLAAIKEIASTQIARLLFPFAAGGGAAPPGFSAGRGLFGRLLGVGGLATAPSFGFPGAPGGTPGFAGPVGAIGAIPGLAGGGQQGQVAVSAGSGGLGSITNGLGLFGALKQQSGLSGAAGLGGLALGGAALGILGGFKLGQSGSTAGRALAPAIGAFSGAVGFGALASLFPALIGLGPIGFAIGAGVGATIALVGVLRKSAEQRIIDKARAVYGVTISRQFAKDPLLGIIKQNFGGNIDVGIRSPQVKDLIELYAMSTGQNSQGIVNRPVARSFGLNSSGAFVQQPTFVNGSAIDITGTPGAVATNAVAEPPVVNNYIVLDGQVVQAQTLNAVARNPRNVASALSAASQQNSYRRENLGLALQPAALLA